LQPLHELGGACSSISYFKRVSDDYQSLVLHSEYVTQNIDELSNNTAAELLLSPGYVTKLNDAFLEFTKIQEKVELSQSRLNFVDQSLEKELKQFTWVLLY
jgi:hypothetical protein